MNKAGSGLVDQLDGIKDEIAKSNNSSQNPIERYQQTIASLKAAGIIPSANSQGVANHEAYQTFDNLAGNDRWKSSSQLESPESPYELRAGFVIPGTLIGGINSDSPGQIVAQVKQNVYDTATGRHLLIPLGSRLGGSYDSDIARSGTLAGRLAADNLPGWQGFGHRCNVRGGRFRLCGLQ